MLHPGVRCDDKEPREPRSGKYQHGRDEMYRWAHAIPAIEQHAKEGRFEKERKHAFHAQRLSDDPSSRFRESRPIGAELKFHRDPRDDSHREVDRENTSPESGGGIVGVVLAEERYAL